MSNEHIQTDRCGFDRNESISQDCYVCTCGWSAEPFHSEYEGVAHGGSRDLPRPDLAVTAGPSDKEERTPRTDAVERAMNMVTATMGIVDAAFARQLELELADLRAYYEAEFDAHMDCHKRQEVLEAKLAVSATPRSLPPEFKALLVRLDHTPGNLALRVFAHAVLGDVTINDLREAVGWKAPHSRLDKSGTPDSTAKREGQ